MASADWVWAGIIAAGVAFETYALKNGRDGDTLSEVTRSAFRVRTRAGAILFGVAWTSFSAWYLGHVIWGWDFPGF